MVLRRLKNVRLIKLGAILPIHDIWCTYHLTWRTVQFRRGWQKENTSKLSLFTLPLPTELIAIDISRPMEGTIPRLAQQAIPWYVSQIYSCYPGNEYGCYCYRTKRRYWFGIKLLKKASDRVGNSLELIVHPFQVIRPDLDVEMLEAANGFLQTNKHWRS